MSSRPRTFDALRPRYYANEFGTPRQVPVGSPVRIMDRAEMRKLGMMAHAGGARRRSVAARSRSNYFGGNILAEEGFGGAARRRTLAARKRSVAAKRRSVAVQRRSVAVRRRSVAARSRSNYFGGNILAEEGFGGARLHAFRPSRTSALMSMHRQGFGGALRAAARRTARRTVRRNVGTVPRRRRTTRRSSGLLSYLGGNILAEESFAGARRRRRRRTTSVRRTTRSRM